MNTGLLFEPLVPVIKRIRPHTKENAIFVPERAVSFITLMYRYSAASERAEYDSADVRSIKRDGVDATVQLNMNSGYIRYGRISGARLETELHHPNGTVTGEYDTLCHTYIMPLSTETFGTQLPSQWINVGKSRWVTVNISYEYGTKDTRIHLPEL